MKDRFEPMTWAEEQEELSMRTCEMCNEHFFIGDEAYEIENELMCEDCAHSYLLNFITSILE